MFAVLHSKNVKVGDVAATYAPIRQTCPVSCPMRDNGCYAQYGNVRYSETRVSQYVDGMNGDTVAILEADEVCDMARKAPRGHAIRLHVSGDATSDFRASHMARAADTWRRVVNGPVWSYTHAWRDVARDSWGTVSILASCESTADAAVALAKGYAAAVVVASHPADGRAYRTSEGVKVIPCPSQTRDIKCTECRLCWDDAMLIAQGAAIAFATHGTGKKRALTVLK